MKINRVDLLKRLKVVFIGVSDKPMLEQSTAFVFNEGRIIAFNDEVMAEAPGWDELEGAVDAKTLIRLLERFPDEEVDIKFSKNEMRVSAGKRDAGISAESEVRLPYASVPAAGKFYKLPTADDGGVVFHLLQAARSCSTDNTQVMATCVHVTPKLIEGCDNSRLYRVETVTGFPSECLVPASVINEVSQFPMKSIAAENGWAHFKLACDFGVAIVHVRCAKGDGYPDVTELLKVKGEEFDLPKNLPEILSRAEVMLDSAHSSRVAISLSGSELRLESRSPDMGWYRERSKVEYGGTPITFEVNPRFLVDAMQYTHTVVLGKGRMKLKLAGAHVVIAFAQPIPADSTSPEKASKKTKGETVPVTEDGDEIPF